MCYGDPFYGSDGIAMREMEKEEMLRQAEQDYERQMYEELEAEAHRKDHEGEEG
jgi:hypothetical protein